MNNLKENLNAITNQLTSDSTLGDVYEQLAKLSDIANLKKTKKRISFLLLQKLMMGLMNG